VGGRPVNKYSPLASVTALRRIPFSASITVTVTWERTPPEASVTVPFMFAAAPTPCAWAVLSSPSKTSRHTKHDPPERMHRLKLFMKSPVLDKMPRDLLDGPALHQPINPHIR